MRERDGIHGGAVEEKEKMKKKEIVVIWREIESGNHSESVGKESERRV